MDDHSHCLIRLWTPTMPKFIVNKAAVRFDSSLLTDAKRADQKCNLLLPGKLGIVGASGAGTTLVSLLCAFMTPNKGLY